MLEPLLILLLGVVVMSVIIAANGYFVAQEFAYMSVDRTRLAAQERAGDKIAGRALKVTRRTSFMLSGAQLGITVTGLMVGYVAEPLIGRSLGEMLGDVGVPAAVSISIGTVLALAVATIVQMIFGELYPKNLAIAAPEPLARRLAGSTLIYLTVFGWLITVFDHAANAFLRLFRIEPVHDLDTTATAKDLEQIVADSRESGDLPEELSMLLDRILDFPDRDVEHAMIPRTHTGLVAPETTAAEIRALMAEAHSRYPVLSGDEPVGVVHMDDLLKTPVEETTTAKELMRPALVLPTLMSLPDALGELVGSQNELACVIDEHGGFVGVLSIEDLAEELVGEITDEHDALPSASIETIEHRRSWQLTGDVHLDEFQRAIGHDLPEGDYETVAGLLIAEQGGLPEPGTTVTVDLPQEANDLVSEKPVRRTLEVQVLSVARHVPNELSARVLETDETEPDENNLDDGANETTARGGEVQK
ncbi:hemolysin family protein [Zhihengliuella salsuginis]|uniref:Membrane protein n=1 Tax=Zhihengliuella salsuginis TaxID=578222 RepID=A0ABQ3GJU8_9MICC|nr:hemolysin family protein [Zhihengliuella salsuginis]GHD09245.1 membrane protein [Zhihengliuella salsuginis]